MAWTLLALTKHLMRQRSVRILLLCFLLTLLWVQSPRLIGASVNRVFLGAGSIQASWPRSLVYAWLLLVALRLGRLQDRILVRVPHPLELRSSWFLLRLLWESLVLWLMAELLVFGISTGLGAWFHVEPSQVLTNLLLSLSATLTLILFGSALRNRYWILSSLGLVVGLTELFVLNLSRGWDQARFGMAILLIATGLIVVLNPVGIHRCKSQS